MKHRRLRGPPAAVCSEEIATRFLFVAEYRRRKQLRGFRGVPKRKIVRALPNIVHDVGKATRIETPGCQMDGDSEISCNRIRHSEFSRMSRERTVCKQTSCKTKFCTGKNPYSGQLGCRGSEPARQPSRLKGLPCYGNPPLGVYSDVARANRPKVIVTAGLNAASESIIQNFPGCRGSEPSVSRPAVRQNSALARNHSGQLGCREREPARQPARLKGMPCIGKVSLGVYSDVARANRPKVYVTAGLNAASECDTQNFPGCRGANRL